MDSKVGFILARIPSLSTQPGSKVDSSLMGVLKLSFLLFPVVMLVNGHSVSLRTIVTMEYLLLLSYLLRFSPPIWFCLIK